MVITLKTRNIRSLFPLKDKNDYKSCVIYKGDCFCGSRYIGESKRNAEVRWFAFRFWGGKRLTGIQKHNKHTK